MLLDELAVPIVQAPMAGGPSTPLLAAEVSNAGGLGFVAAGYRSAADVADDLAGARSLTDGPLGVNLFAPPVATGDPAQIDMYIGQLERSGAGPLGAPRSDDDEYDAKVEHLVAHPVAAVSLTFGLPARDVVDRLHAAGSEVWVTVTRPGEAQAAVAGGADVLVVQGVEAGGHRGSFGDGGGDIGLLALLQLVRAVVDVPLVATGGIATGAGIAAVLAAGARAAQLGTAFMLAAEAGTHPAHRELLGTERTTALTRAFTGRLARGILNRFQADHSIGAPSAYPEIHHVTAPLRAAARRAGDADSFNLWAGQAHMLTEAVPARELVQRLAADARRALDDARL